jgi:hypothetical protein
MEKKDISNKRILFHTMNIYTQAMSKCFTKNVQSSELSESASINMAMEAV